MSEEYKIKNVERMLLLVALEAYGMATKDAAQRAAVFDFMRRLQAASTITLANAA